VLHGAAFRHQRCHRDQHPAHIQAKAAGGGRDRQGRGQSCSLQHSSHHSTAASARHGSVMNRTKQSSTCTQHTCWGAGAGPWLLATKQHCSDSTTSGVGWSMCGVQGTLSSTSCAASYVHHRVQPTQPALPGGTSMLAMPTKQSCEAAKELPSGSSHDAPGSCR
jgi:hypothetical protein